MQRHGSGQWRTADGVEPFTLDGAAIRRSGRPHKWDHWHGESICKRERRGTYSLTTELIPNIGTLRSCLIAYNRATGGTGAGGGVGFYAYGGRIENGTIVTNTAGSGDIGYLPLGSGGIWHHGSGTVTMTNSIVYFNKAPTNTDIGGTLSAGYSCSPDLTDGVDGNLTANPKFRSLSGGDYHLARSPCVDHGIIMSWMTGAVDLEGNRRIVNGLADMGAYGSTYPIGSSFIFR